MTAAIPTERHLDDAIDLLRRLVAERSVAGADAAIGRCLDIAEAELAPVARRIERLVFAGLPALVVDIGDGPAERRLLLAGHVDVVDAGDDWDHPPFALTRVGDDLVGRGVTDMKGPVAAFLAAIGLLAERDALGQCALRVVLTGDEKVGSERGTIPLVRQGTAAGAGAVCTEPTGLDVYLGNRGLVWATVAIRGRGGHAGLAHALANPIPVAAEAVRALAAIPLDARDERFDPPVPTLTVTRIVGTAGGPNVIPDAVELAIDRRLLPGEDPDAALAAIKAAVAGAVPPPFSFAVTPRRRWPPYVIADERDPLVRAAQRAVRATGRAGALGTDQPADDSSWIGNAGTPTILLGPGDPLQAHARNERLTVSEFRDAIAAYAGLITGFAESTV